MYDGGHVVNVQGVPYGLKIMSFAASLQSDIKILPDHFSHLLKKGRVLGMQHNGVYRDLSSLTVGGPGKSDGSIDV